MDAAADPLALESLLAFWADAGVDACLAEAPVDKLARPAPTPPPKPAVSAAQPGAATATAPLIAGDAQARAAQATDLSELQAGLEAVSGRRPVLFARGAEEPLVVVVGGPPGEAETTAGSAFAGPTGRLLDRMLTAAGLLDRALLLHLVPWRTPGDGPPTTADAALALPFVARAIALARPAALLVLGEEPAALLLGRAEGVRKLRGTLMDNLPQAAAPDLPPSLVTFSPAFLLKQPRVKAQAWSDLLTLSAAVAAPRNDP